MADLTPTRLAEIAEAAEKATPGDWVNDAPGCVGINYGEGGKATICTCPIAFSWHNGENDAAFIALSRTAIPELLSHIARLEADKAKLREAVRKLRACPALFDIAPEDMDEEDIEADRFARTTLEETA